jgi:hypothetical protein
MRITPPRLAIFWILVLLIGIAFTPASASNNGKQQEGGGIYANLTAVWWQWVYAAWTVDHRWCDDITTRDGKDRP